ncbi:hypothetical protein [Methanoregula sp.]|uniref:hypothetical protein n=1 Tax=Methanoregula sp. TaxID=2052170 RepID=UPI003561F0D3
MDEWGFFGLSIGTIANLAVAGATLCMVFYTYKAVKSSECQITINQKEKERPVVLEFINSQLNRIQDDIWSEIEIIKQNAVSWQKNYPIKDRDYAALVFPLPYQKEFYIQFGEVSIPWFLRSNRTIISQVKNISNLLEKRHEIYNLMEKNMEALTKEGNDAIFNQIIKSNFQSNSDDPDFFDSFYFDPIAVPESGQVLFVIRSPLPSMSNIKSISENNLIDDVKSLITVSLFKNNTYSDWRLSKRSFLFEVFPVLNKVKSLLQKTDQEKITNSKKIIDNQILVLKKIDSDILSEISQIKKILQESYWFTSLELNKI